MTQARGGSGRGSSGGSGCGSCAGRQASITILSQHPLPDEPGCLLVVAAQHGARFMYVVKIACCGFYVIFVVVGELIQFIKNRQRLRIFADLGDDRRKQFCPQRVLELRIPVYQLVNMGYLIVVKVAVGLAGQWKKPGTRRSGIVNPSFMRSAPRQLSQSDGSTGSALLVPSHRIAPRRHHGV